MLPGASWRPKRVSQQFASRWEKLYIDCWRPGRTAATPCFWCRRFTDQASCRLFATRADRACAYCKRFNKTSCSAIAETEEETATRAERLAAEKERLVAENESLTDRVGRQERRIARLETSFGQLQDLAAQVHSLASNADSRVAEVEGGIGQLRGTPGIASGRLDQLESEFSRAYAKARSHEDQLALLESHLAEHQAYIKGMKAKESSRSGNTAGSSSFRAF